ncbi:MAG TPA: sigma factor-like helix-turn-helix DNA-binding protein, partial [Polyangiaceae bacterium]|nr:sigma factor-like helix-turn-helix DNA-binding protein [Polyangiaceae bacterium]
MTQQMWFCRGGERVREAFDAALAWCEGCCVVTESPTAADASDELWLQLGRASDRVRAAILANIEAAESDLIAPFFNAGRIRRLVDATHHDHFIWFERDGEVRFLLAPAALRKSTMDGSGLWMYCEGQRGALPEGLQTAIESVWSASVLSEPAEVLGGAASVGAPAAYSRPIPSVREVLGIRTPRDYFELEEADQERALWSTLIGEGPVDLEQGIRLCAERLRAQGFLDYQRLHQDGRVYSALEERLLAARRRLNLFDRPRSGFVRAIQSEIGSVTAEQWRDCLMGALEQGAHVDRDEAVRLGFEYAQATYGVNVQRLRNGGRADQALRSAINSSVRQGYLRRDGAAYLLRVALQTEPTLRGAIGVGADAPNPAQETASSPLGDGIEAAPVAMNVETDASTPAASEATPSSPNTEAESLPLDRDVQSLPLPARTLNWCARCEVSTLRELVAWQPAAFENEKNVGPSTVRETREVIESLLGCTWEQAHSSVHDRAVAIREQAQDTDTSEDDAPADSVTAGGAAAWVRLAAQLSDEARMTPLVDIQLPTRMRNYAQSEGLERLGDLFSLPYAALSTAANLGRKSLNDTMEAVREYVNGGTAPLMEATFLQAWQAELSALEPIPRMIVTRRAGMHGERETLEELGAMLGVSRERVRQIEARVLEHFARRSRWRRLVEAKLLAAFGSARALPLDLLAEDAWWSGIDEQELLLDYVVRRIFEDELFVLEAPSGRRYLTKFGPNEFVSHLESAKNRVAKLEYPVEVSVIDAILRAEIEALDPVLLEELREAVDALLLRDTANPSVILGYGRYRADDVIAFLNGQSEPVPVDVLEAHCGRGALPEEVLYFKRGYVGLKRHFPDFDDWSHRLVPVALELMQERPSGRQWLVPEIHEALRERGLLPEWLGHWHLASLLRLSQQVDYLGRLRVALKAGGHEQRVQYLELLQQIVEDAGEPLALDELLARARRRTDVPDMSAMSRLNGPPFVRIDDARIGLVVRDIPGGPQAVAAAIEAVVRTLTESQVGLTPHRATVHVNGISDTHATWSRQLVTSVLRNESTIRIDRTRNIGLDAWDDARCPTRPEFIRREVQRAGGSLTLSELCNSMNAFYGRVPDRGSLGLMAQQVGLGIVGETIQRTSDRGPVEAIVER